MIILMFLKLMLSYSFEVLQGAYEYLKNNSPTLQVEILSRKIDFADKRKKFLII